MTHESVLHDTFTLERTFAVPPATAFAAFASAEAKAVWGDTGNLESVEGESGGSIFEFRAGGHESFAIKMEQTTFRYDARYYDIVLNRRIVYAYEMYAGEARISVSLATLEFVPIPEGTRFTWTEQGTYLDGIDGEGAPRLREGGTAEMLDGLSHYLMTRTTE